MNHIDPAACVTFSQSMTLRFTKPSSLTEWTRFRIWQAYFQPFSSTSVGTSRAIVNTLPTLLLLHTSSFDDNSAYFLERHFPPYGGRCDSDLRLWKRNHFWITEMINLLINMYKDCNRCVSIGYKWWLVCVGHMTFHPINSKSRLTAGVDRLSDGTGSFRWIDAHLGRRVVIWTRYRWQRQTKVHCHLLAICFFCHSPLLHIKKWNLKWTFIMFVSNW